MVHAILYEISASKINFPNDHLNADDLISIS